MLKALALLALVAAATAAPVLDADHAALQTLLKESPFTFVVFHGNDCPYCDYLRGMLKELAVEAAATYPDLRFALINAEHHEETRKAHNIESYPVGKLFAGDYLFNFFIQRLAREHILTFLHDTLGKKAVATEIASDKAFVRFNNLDYGVALTFPEVTDAERAFAQNLQALFPTVPIFFTAFGSKWDGLLFKDKPAAKKYRLLFKRDFDDGDKSFAREDLFVAEDIAATLRRIKDPVVRLANKAYSDEVFSGLHPALVLFDKDLDSPRVHLLTKLLQEVSFRGVPLKTDGKGQEAEAFVNYLGIADEDYPALRIVGIGQGKVTKFRYDGEWIADAIKAFLKDFQDSKLPQYYKSARKAPKRGDHVDVWNREQYMQNVADGENTLVVGMVAKYCARCAEVPDMLVETRAQIRDKKSFVFGLVNLNMNDIDGVEPAQAPLIQIVRGGTKETYKGNWSAEALAGHLNGIPSDDL